MLSNEQMTMNSHRTRRTCNGKPVTLTVELGGLADHLRDQLRAQGIRLPLHVTSSLERTRRAIIQLRATRYISAAQASRAELRLLAIIKKAIQHVY